MRRTIIKKNIPRLLALLLAMTLVFAMAPAASAAEGTCGDSLTWSFDSGTLTITGSGPMTNYSEGSPAPWAAYRDAILSVSLPDGLTRVGSYAFYNCKNLTSVTIPGTVEIVGRFAFYNCSSMTMATLNEGLRTIDVCAFEQCSALSDLRLPGSLITIGDHAFYLCKGLSYVTIPGAVKSFGSGVFAYCSGLIRVDVNAAVTLPGWTFYGCDNLQTVTIQGESVSPASLKVSDPPKGSGNIQPSTKEPEDVYEETQPAPAPVVTEPVSPAPDEGKASSNQLTTDSSGGLVLDNTTVQKTENATTVNSTKTPSDENQEIQTSISSTVQNDQGWQEVVDQINSALLNQTNAPVDVTVYTPSGDSVSKETLQELAGKNVTLTVQTKSGSKFTLDCKKLDEKIRQDLVLSYTLTSAETIPEALLGCTVYRLNFHESAQIVTEMIIRLPGEHKFQTASLYQLKRGEPEHLQSVMVDSTGNAHWYLRSVDKKTDYLIGINVPGVITDSPIIPAELHGVHKVANVFDGKEYIVTGRTSSWGMGLGKVMTILAVVMVSMVVVVGFVMYAWNKRRLKMGYVPDLDEEDYM